MLLFSTKLDIVDSMTIDDFISLVIEWNQGSRHPENVIPEISWNGEHNICYGNPNLWMEIQEYRNQNIVAVRYEKREEDGIIWDTDYVMNFNEHRMAIRLDRSYTEDALVTNDAFSTPYFIAMLIREGYVREDAGLSLSNDPIYITNVNMNILTDVVAVRKEHKLPIVYVSKTEFDTDPVNVKDLSWRLKGIAHVLVQTSSLMTDAMISECGQQIERNGEIGIYYPNQTITSRRFTYNVAGGYDEKLQKAAINTVLKYCNSQVVGPLYTWFGVNNALLQDKLDSQREKREDAENRLSDTLKQLVNSITAHEAERKDIEKKAQDEAYAILDEFQTEIDDYKDQIERLNNEVSRLQAENYGLRNKLASNGSHPILNTGDQESDIYPGEVKDLVLSALIAYLRQIAKGTRRYDVLTDVINSNDYQGSGEKRKAEIHRLIDGYTRITPVIKNGLKDLRIELTEDGAHCKLKYNGEDRYMSVLAKTPSDVRAGANNASEIIKLFY